MDAKYMRDLAADRAKAEEDLRIARKHTIEAAEREMTPANEAAYKRAVGWQSICRQRRDNIRAEHIRALHSTRPADEDMAGGRNTITRFADPDEAS